MCIVVQPSEFRTLVDTHAIHDEKLKDNDILLLVRRRSLVEEPLTMDIELKAPTQADIDAATSELPTVESGSSGVTSTQTGTASQTWSEGDVGLACVKQSYTTTLQF